MFLEKTWLILEACIPRGTAEKLARSLSRSPDLIRKWQRPPLDEKRPYATGCLNPLDVLEIIQDHAFAQAPGQSHRIHHYLERRHDEHFAYLAPKPLTPAERDKELADVHRELAEAMRAILLGAPAGEVRKEWEDLKREMEELVSRIEAGVQTVQQVQKVQRVK